MNTTRSDNRGRLVMSSSREERSDSGDEIASSRDGSTPGQILPPELIGDARDDRDRGHGDDRRDDRRDPERFGEARGEMATFGERRDALGVGPVDEHECADGGERPTHDERAVGRRQRRVPERTESGDAEHEDRGAARRERRQREHGEHGRERTRQRAEHHREPEPRCGRGTDRTECDGADRGDRTPRRTRRRRTPLAVLLARARAAL